MDVFGVYQLLANVESDMQRESIRFAIELIGHVNKDLKEFGQNIVAFGDKICHMENVTIHNVK